MKKLIALTLALLMLTMSFVACNKTETPAETTEAVENNQTEAPVVEETTEAVEETTTTTIPEESIVPTTAPTTQDWTEEECPNGTAWA